MTRSFGAGALLLLAASTAEATIVRFDTTLGSVYVDLLEEEAPGTVANFLSYLRDGAYRRSIIHRSSTGFVVQGGGFGYQNEAFVAISTNDPIANEPGISNSRGTLAMAKIDGDPDSATSQWFFNIDDNTELDDSNGGFTVFGRVLGDGMDVVDQLNSLVIANFDGGALAQVPIIVHGGISSLDDIDASNLVFVTITEVDGFRINTGLNGAWFNPATPGQGMTFDVIDEPGRREFFAAWFTYDVEAPMGDDAAGFGSTQHRWFTGSGAFNGNRTTLTLQRNSGGIFNDPTATTADVLGELVIEFEDCANATATVDFRASNRFDSSFPLVRLSPDVFCESLTVPASNP